jgi:hypothetical protein
MRGLSCIWWWDPARNGSKLIGTLCNCSKKTIINYAMIENRPLLFHGLEGPSKVMESQTIQELMSTIMCPGLSLQDLVSDNDIAIAKVIRTSGAIGLHHPLDIGHSPKSRTLMYRSIKRNNRILNRVGAKLLTQCWSLIRQDLPVPQKKLMWPNSLEHFLGIHSLCGHEASYKECWLPYQKRPSFRELLISGKKRSIFDFVSQGTITQSNESFNSQNLGLPLKTMCGGIPG